MAEVDDLINEPSEVEKRIKTLSDKVRQTAEERDGEKAARETDLAKAKEVERERDFYQGFADVVSTNPAAKDHKEAILEKVKGGYTVEDATYAVLGKAGKLGGSKTVETQTIAGGSAVTNPPQGGDKSIQEMTQAERRELLMERENDLRDILSPRMGSN